MVYTMMPKRVQWAYLGINMSSYSKRNQAKFNLSQCDLGWNMAGTITEKT